MSESRLLKTLRINCMIKVLLIFGGLILCQAVAFLMTVLGYVGIQIVMGESLYQARINLAFEVKNSTLLMVMSAISAVIAMIWCGILYKKSSFRQETFDYKTAFDAKSLGYMVCVGMGGSVLLTILLTVLAGAFPAMFENYNDLMSNFDTDTSSMGFAWITVVYALLIGPVSEELIFRGAIFDRFHLAFSFWIANVLQAAAFGIYHMNFVQGVYAFILGIVLGMIKYSVGSIIASIIVHIAFNSVSYILPVLLCIRREELRYLSVAVVLFVVVESVRGIGYFVNKSNLREKSEHEME